MKALFITPHSLLGFSGGTIATKNFLKIIKLAFNDNVTVVADKDSKPELINNGVSDYRLIESRNTLQKLFFFIKGESIDRFSPGFDIEELDISQYTHLIIDNAILGRFARLIKEKFPNIFIITLHHNYERKFYSDSNRSLIEKLFINRILDFNQGSAFKFSDLNLMLTFKDLEDVENRYGAIRQDKKCVFGYYESIKAEIIKNNLYTGKIRLIITGNLSVKKGYSGVITFIEKIFANLNKKKYSLLIAGKDPVKKLVSIAEDHKEINIISNPIDMSPFLRESDIYLNPCFSGSGIKIRNFDGLRMGLPVVCKYGNHHGFEHYSDSSFITYDTIEEFEGAVSRVSTDRNLVFQEYFSKSSLESGLKKFNSLMKSRSDKWSCN